MSEQFNQQDVTGQELSERELTLIRGGGFWSWVKRQVNHVGDAVLKVGSFFSPFY